MAEKIHLTVNGESNEISIEPWETLLEILRYKFGLTGIKESCGRGDCGSCSVILNNKLVDACLVLAVDARDGEVLTIEGLNKGTKLHPIQEAFIEHGAIQCGFCTSGMITSAKALLDENPNPTEAEVRKAITGNLCRCTGYKKIVEAILAAAKKQSRDDSRHYC